MQYDRPTGNTSVCLIVITIILMTIVILLCGNIYQAEASKNNSNNNTINSNSKNIDSTLRNSTDGNSVDIVLEFSDNSTVNIGNSNMQFRILFFNPQNDKIQRHIDYDFILMEKNEEIYRLSNQTNQPLFPVHSNNGIGFVPIFSDLRPGEYVAKITVNGILFNPILPEEAEFAITHK